MKKGIGYYQIGETVELALLIKQAKKGIASNGKPFLSLMMTDKTGDIEAKMWGVKPEDESVYRTGTVIYVQGDVQDYRGMRQLRLKSVRPAHDKRAEDYMPSAPMSIEAMLEKVNEYLFAMDNPKIQRLTRHLLKKHQEAFLISPAAVKNHHEYSSGLIYHVVSMLELGRSFAKLYPSLNKDLLYGGIILHDLAKVNELTGPLGTQYTLEGKLLGHISMMHVEIETAAAELQIEGEEILLLKHMILSHHGKGEWGSPKPPMIREAEMLHMIDNIDARMAMMDRALERTSPGEFSERIFAMEQRSFYHPNM
ncbi:3'-5' exoribonuclease YhaM [Alkalicoccus luteus]|uniref:3'-5' exoribonuclease YhaM n=1 Tax=Alkalicoccus luteus TaxID=1237094 RepID=UPI0040340D68